VREVQVEVNGFGAGAVVEDGLGEGVGGMEADGAATEGVQEEDPYDESHL
jgi:hypothetical protein